MTRGEKTRQKIVATAAGLFQEHGYKGTGLDTIVRRARVTKGAFYHHFASKKDVALAVIADVVAPIIRRRMIEPVARAPRGEAAIALIAATIKDETAPEELLTGCPLGNLANELALHDPDLQRAVAAVFLEWEEAWTAALKRDGRRDARARGITLIALIEGAQSLAKAQRSREPIDIVFKNLRLSK